jgi:hypothetical protein
MKPFEPTPELLEVASRVVWFKEPSATLNDPIHFLAYAMKLGTADDLIALDKAGINLAHFQEVLDNTPSGIFDERSWAYWNLRCGRKPVPPLPVRKLDD